MNILVNKRAPVVYQSQIEIQAPVQKVWRTLTELKDWPKWQKNISSVQIIGGIEEGKSFQWKADHLVFSSNIHTVRNCEEFGWTGTIPGVKAIHNWTFKKLNSNTMVEVEESLQGFLPAIFRKKLQKDLERGMLDNLMALKNASETALNSTDTLFSIEH